VRVQNFISGGGEDGYSYEYLINDTTINIGNFKLNMKKALNIDELDLDKFGKMWNLQYDEMRGKGDFAHQQITSATILATLLNREGPLAMVALEDSKREELAGWFGDATLSEKGNPPSLGKDDYIADLDAVNITNIIKQENIPYVEAMNKYYQQVGREYTRASKFLEDTSIEEVKEKIFATLVDEKIIEDYRREHERPAMEAFQDEELQRRLNDEELKLEYLKERAPDTYNFILSLSNPFSHNEMGVFNE
jgi:hypothetical protein